jgi:predicted O-methyltransferase YrrM
MLALRAALSASGLKPSGVFVPTRDAPRLRPSDYPAVARLFAAFEPTFRHWLDRLDRYADIFRSLSGPPPRPRLTQDWFPRLDATIAYTIVRDLRPRRIVEVGSGHSTRFLSRAVADAASDCEILCIDPKPRAALEGLAVRHVARRLQEVPEESFAVLAPGDVLFIDSSHLALPGSDVDHFFHRILPALPAGVLVHVHDIFLPDPYPREWAWRGYGEQLLVASWLLAGRLEPVFASHWVATRMREKLAQTVIARLPLAEGAYETSLWARLLERPPWCCRTTGGRTPL